jgi:hypothetical protein
MAGEGLLQKYYKARCKENGILWYKIKFEGVRGCPDTLAAKNGKTIISELKNPNKKGALSKQQVRRINEMLDAGIDVRVIDSKEGVDDVIKELLNA